MYHPSLGVFSWPTRPLVVWKSITKVPNQKAAKGPKCFCFFSLLSLSFFRWASSLLCEPLTVAYTRNSSILSAAKKSHYEILIMYNATSTAGLSQYTRHVWHRTMLIFVGDLGVWYHLSEDLSPRLICQKFSKIISYTVYMPGCLAHVANNTSIATCVDTRLFFWGHFIPAKSPRGPWNIANRQSTYRNIQERPKKACSRGRPQQPHFCQYSWIRWLARKTGWQPCDHSWQSRDWWLQIVWKRHFLVFQAWRCHEPLDRCLWQHLPLLQPDHFKSHGYSPV